MATSVVSTRPRRLLIIPPGLTEGPFDAGMGRTMRPPPPFTRSLAVALGVSAGWLLVVAVIAAAAGDLEGIAVLAAVGALMAGGLRRGHLAVGPPPRGLARRPAPRHGPRPRDRSQQAFRRAISRLGETLAATHDRDKILEAVSETAQLAVGAQRGIFYEYAPARKVLVARSGIGPDAPELSLPLGTGLAGTSAAQRAPIRFPGPTADTGSGAPGRSSPSPRSGRPWPSRSPAGASSSAWWPSTATPPARPSATTTSRRWSRWWPRPAPPSTTSRSTRRPSACRSPTA